MVDEVRRVGMDEQSFGTGHGDVSVLTDVDARRVLEVSEGRDEATADALGQALPDEQRTQVAAVAMDMRQAFENSAAQQAPQADVVLVVPSWLIYSRNVSRDSCTTATC